MIAPDVISASQKGAYLPAAAIAIHFPVWTSYNVETGLLTSPLLSKAIFPVKRVRYFSTVEPTNALELEKSTGKQGQIAHKLMYVDLVILDELGYLPFSQTGGALLFHLLSKSLPKLSDWCLLTLFGRS